jgi:hypothetical protein
MPIIPLLPVAYKWPLAVQDKGHDHARRNHNFLIADKLNVVEPYLTKIKKKIDFSTPCIFERWL